MRFDRLLGIATAISVCAFSSSGSAATVTVDLTELSGRQNSFNVDVGGLADLTITADTFERESFFPLGPLGTFELDGDTRVVIDANQGNGDAGLGALNPGDNNDDIDGRGDNEILMFSLDTEVTLLSILFDNVDGNDDFFFSFGDFQPAPGADFLGRNFGIIPIGGPGNDDGIFNASFTGSWFGIGALGFFDNVRIKEVTFDVPDVPDVPVPASLPLLIAGMVGLFALRRRQRWAAA